MKGLFADDLRHRESMRTSKLSMSIINNMNNASVNNHIKCGRFSNSMLN